MAGSLIVDNYISFCQTGDENQGNMSLPWFKPRQERTTWLTAQDQFSHWPSKGWGGKQEKGKNL